MSKNHASRKRDRSHWVRPRLSRYLEVRQRKVWTGRELRQSDISEAARDVVEIGVAKIREFFPRTKKSLDFCESLSVLAVGTGLERESAGWRFFAGDSSGVRHLSGSPPVEALVERDMETMNKKITMTKSRQILGFCTICTAVAFVSVAAGAQDTELDLELLRAAFEAADTSGDGRIDEAELAADTIEAFVAVDSNGDDRLSAEELREAGVESIGTLDVDKNLSLTIVEVMNAKILEFQDADANSDGELTIEEISRFERRR